MIKFRQKEFITPLNRVGARSTRFARRMKFLNPTNYFTSSGKEALKKESKALMGDIRLSKRDAIKNAKSIGDISTDFFGGNIRGAAKTGIELAERTPIAAMTALAPQVPGGSIGKAVAISAAPFIERTVAGVQELGKLPFTALKKVMK